MEFIILLAVFIFFMFTIYHLEGMEKNITQHLEQIHNELETRQETR